MRIVLLNQFFWPDAVATAQLLSDVAEVLAEENDVTVLCSGKSKRCLNGDSTFGHKITVVRAKGLTFSHRRISRIVSYLSYLAGTIWHGVRLPAADIYLTLTTPPFLSAIGSGLAFFQGAHHIIWEMDVYPDIAIDIGYLKRGGIAERLVSAILDWPRRRASAIIVLGADMRDRLTARGISEEKIHIAENWADGEEIRPLGLTEGPLVITYSGNFGLAHEFDTIWGVIERLGDNPSFRFVFAGDGPRRSQLQIACRKRDIRNVHFRPYCKRTDLGKSLGEGHLGLVTQLSGTIGSIVPSKVYGIMAAGRPILYIGPQGSTPSQYICRYDCGWQIVPGDVDHLQDLLLHLNRSRGLIAEAGARARMAFDANFDRSIGVGRIIGILDGFRHSGKSAATLTQAVIR
jgi:colanic acid biosynthesis glycosyl transferase WcaI